ITGFGFATMYQFVWDLFMDWGLIHFTQEGRPHLRRNRLFGSSTIYIAIIIFNFLMRFLWAATLLPESRLSIVTIILEVWHTHTPIWTLEFCGFSHRRAVLCFGSVVFFPLCFAA